MTVKELIMRKSRGEIPVLSDQCTTQKTRYVIYKEMSVLYTTVDVHVMQTIYEQVKSDLLCTLAEK